MTKEEKELAISYLEDMKESYIEGNGYERHPLPEYYAIETAIKALNQEPSVDCIDRNALDEALYERFHEEDSPNNITDVRLGAVRNFVQNFPSVMPTYWIPCSSGQLPEDFQRVLVTIVNYNGDKVVRVAEYRRRTFKIKENYEQWNVGEKGLLAWCPLPEPYEEKEN